MSTKTTIDSYVFDTLMRDLVEHGRKPSAFLVYLFLWHRTFGGARPASLSHLRISESTGLSKSSVQGAVKMLIRRKLLRSYRANSTSTPEYTVLRPWIR
jgi:hypothetical protein